MIKCFTWHLEYLGNIDHIFQTQFLHKHMALPSVSQEAPIGYPVLLIANCLQNDSLFLGIDVNYLRKQTKTAQHCFYQGCIIWAK